MIKWIRSNPESAKRLIVKLLGVAVVMLGPLVLSRFGVAITDAQLESVAAIVVGYLLQSGYNSAAQATAEIVSAEDAQAIIAAAATPPSAPQR
jgi:hypothetical protein